jgi:hypothetical protein
MCRPKSNSGTRKLSEVPPDKLLGLGGEVLLQQCLAVRLCGQEKLLGSSDNAGSCLPTEGVCLEGLRHMDKYCRGLADDDGVLSNKIS